MSAATILWLGHLTFIAACTVIVAALAWSIGRKSGFEDGLCDGYDRGQDGGEAAGYRKGKADGERIGHARALMESQAALDRIARES